MSSPLKLGMLAASPMYYQAPLYRRIANEPGVEFMAYFASSGGVVPHDAGYGRPVSWNVDVLSGYRQAFLRKAPVNPIGGGLLTLRDWDVIAAVARERFDVLWIHGYNVLTNLLAAATQRVGRRAVLLREEQTLLAPRPRWKQAVKAVGLPLLLGRATAVYIGSENKRWLERFGFPEDRLFYAPYCVDAERLDAMASKLPDRSWLRRHLGVDERLPLILTVARLVPDKQPLELLDAFARVRRRHPSALLVVGAGELEARMRSKVEEEQIPSVTFTGFLDQQEIAMAYAAADMFALFSRYEPWGLVINEAMHFGLPVVASNRVGAASDLVKQGVTGFVVPHNDRQSLADRLEQLVVDAVRRRRIGVAARDHVAGWNYERAAQGILAAARAAAKRTSR